MLTWTITIKGKNVRKAGIEALAKSLRAKYGKDTTITVTATTPPESRADRFSEAQSRIVDAKGEAEALRDELQEWHDNLPENFQQGDKGEQLTAAIDQLENFISQCEEAENSEVDFPTMY